MSLMQYFINAAISTYDSIVPFYIHGYAMLSSQTCMPPPILSTWVTHLHAEYVVTDDSGNTDDDLSGPDTIGN